MAQEPETTTKRAELPMRLTRLRVKNFRSIADIDIPLSPLTVLVGPNGSGKSNVVDALRFVRDVFARGLDQAVMDREGMGVIQRWGTEGIEIELSFSSETAEVFSEAEMREAHTNNSFYYVLKGKPLIHSEYKFSIIESDDKSLVVKSEELIMRIYRQGLPAVHLKRDRDTFTGRFEERDWINLFEKERGNWAITSNNQLWLPEVLVGQGYFLFDKNSNMIPYDSDYDFTLSVEFEARNLGDFMSGSSFYTLNPSDLRQPQQLVKETPLDEKGRNLAAVLQRLSRNGNRRWESLRSVLCQTIANFSTLEVEKVGGYLATKLIYQNDYSQRRISYLGQESDGTIRMLGLLAALQQEPSQPFISIEEPEANIHPGALAVLAGVIDEASLRSQILVTTHSPDMLDHLPVESFLVVEKVGDTTHVGPLDANQIASVRKRLFTPGELFRMEGLQRQTEPESAS